MKTWADWLFPGREIEWPAHTLETLRRASPFPPVTREAPPMPPVKPPKGAPRFCKDCRHWIDRGDPGIDLCRRTVVGEPLHLVRGPDSGQRYCDMVRDDEEMCGPSGAWFEPRRYRTNAELAMVARDIANIPLRVHRTKPRDTSRDMVHANA